MKKIILGAALVFSSMCTFAAGWTEPLTVESIFTEGNTDVIVIYTSGGVQNTNGCLANNWIFLTDNDSRRNRAYSTAMAALASGKKVSFWYTDTCATWSFHSATAIKIIK